MTFENARSEKKLFAFISLLHVECRRNSESSSAIKYQTNNHTNSL